VVWILAKMLGHRVAPNSSIRTGVIGRGGNANKFALRIPAVLLGARSGWRIRQPDDSGAHVSLGDARGIFNTHFPAASSSPTLWQPPRHPRIRGLGKRHSADSTVLVAPPHDVGAFVWFTSGSANYLALDQSAGVVFSRTNRA